jgi:nucleoid-associated protein YgaU
MNQGTKIVAVVLFVLFVGTGIYYVTLSPAKPASPSAAKPPEPAKARDPGAITMNPPTATGVQPSEPRIADPLAATGATSAPTNPTNPANPAAMSAGTSAGTSAGSATAATGVAPVAGTTPSRVALGPGGTPSAVMPPLTVNRPATGIAGGTVGGSTAGSPASTGVSGGTASGVSAVRPASAATGLTTPSTPATLAASSSSAREHVVASGDTLSSIAAKYLGSEARWDEIAKANPGVNPNSMRVGTKLAIPAGGAAPKATASATPVLGTNPSAAPSAASTSAREYVVKAGDTLSGIARQTLGNADWETIYDANRDLIGPNPAALKVGMKLSIPKRS